MDVHGQANPSRKAVSRHGFVPPKGGWSYAVTHRPPATFPPRKMYTKSAEEMYLQMRTPRISPNGLGSAIQMQEFFANRAGLRLPDERWHAIKLSSAYLRIELRHLRLQSRRGFFRSEERLLEALQNELAYVLLHREFGLESQPKPVYPPPAQSDRIGGRNGHNGRFRP